MKLLGQVFIVALMLIPIRGIGQSNDLKRLELLKKEIRQSTYYDSAAVFKKGKEAINIARKNHLPAEESAIYQFYGNFYYFSYNMDKAKQFYAKSIETAKKAGDAKLVNSTRIRLAFIESESDILKAEDSFHQLLEEATKYNYVINQIEIYNGLGNIFSERMILDTSLNYYLKGLKIAEKNNKKYHQAMMLNNIGLLKFSNKQVKEAVIDFNRATELLKGLDEDRLMLNLNNNLGLVYKQLEDYSEAVKYYSNTLEYARKLGFPLGISVAHLNLADSYMSESENKRAMLHVDTAIYSLSDLKEYGYLGMAYSIKSSLLRDMNDLVGAKNYAQKILELKDFYSGPNNLIEYHKLLSSIHEKEGNFKLALFQMNRYHAMKDSLAEVSNSDKLSELQVIYGKEQLESELETIRSKNDLLSKENELKRSRINTILILFFSILIVGLGSAYMRHFYITRKQQVVFTQKLIENTDIERSRISKDLHDDIGQSLSIIKSKLNMFNSGKINSVDGLDKEVGEVIDQTRNISHSLHPSAIAKMGLERSLVSILEKTQSSTGIISSLSLKNNVEILPIEVKTQLYRIIQECINNTIKHADATALKVSISIVNDQLKMTYRDNGKGISDEKRKMSGIGMMTMLERAKTINAKINIPLSEKGFKLTLDLYYSV